MFAPKNLILVKKERIDVPQRSEIQDAHMYLFQLPSEYSNLPTLDQKILIYVYGYMREEISSNSHKKLVFINVSYPMASAYINYNDMSKKPEPLRTKWLNQKRGDYTVLISNANSGESVLIDCNAAII